MLKPSGIGMLLVYGFQFQSELFLTERLHVVSAFRAMVKNVLI